MPLTLSNTQSVGGGASAGCRQWRLGGATGLHHCRGSNGGASMGRMRQRIIVGGAYTAPSYVRVAALATSRQWNYGGGIVGVAGGGSASVGRRWRNATINGGW